MSTFLKKNIRNLSLNEIKIFVQKFEEKIFRGNQIYNWIWNQDVKEIKQMNNIPKNLQKKLEKQFYIQHVELKETQYSSDGLLKNKIKLHDGKNIESVLIPSKKRYTGCISSQVGCSLNCTFCATSKLKNIRNLNIYEIYDQVKILDNQSKKYFKKPLTNIVFMGMGEPLLNYKNVIESIKKITTCKKLQISINHITLSTSGIPKMIIKLADENPRFKLAFSLHASQEKIRNNIMPFSKKFPLIEVLDSLKYWYKKTKNRITIEYIIWKNINDQKKDINLLIKFCKSIPSKVNIIEYNSIGESKFKQANKKKIQQYLYSLKKNGIVAKIRYSRGKDINAGCGQLANNIILK